ncbi:MAG: TlyA family RNA methyltransferase [Phycisphaerales bacterium]|nr:MAG: methyltransferase domain-containing protein [Phycisphaerales bacterium]
MDEPKYVSRGGLKLRHALETFSVDAHGNVAADLGCSTGGFTDCLLQAGATKVYSVDTAYGELAWTLRNDPRVVVMERTNALHAEARERVDLVVADMSWTPQRLVIPAALRWCKPEGRIISLVKPHYELKDVDPKGVPRGGVLSEERAEAEFQRVLTTLPGLGVRVLGSTKSPILGGGGKSKGNVEYLVLLQPV